MNVTVTVSNSFFFIYAFLRFYLCVLKFTNNEDYKYLQTKEEKKKQSGDYIYNTGLKPPGQLTYQPGGAQKLKVKTRGKGCPRFVPRLPYSAV